MPNVDLNELGPLAPLVGVWEGDKGDDTAPSDDRGTEKNKFREKVEFTYISPAQNHEQTLYGLRYHLQAFRIGEDSPFHDQVGYWHWDPKAKLVMQALTIPRGQVVLAGGPTEANSKSFKLTAALGSPTFGICSNPFLDKEFKTLAYEITMTLNPDGSLTYNQTTSIQIKDQPRIFEHKDSNTLRKIQAQM